MYHQQSLFLCQLIAVALALISFIIELVASGPRHKVDQAESQAQLVSTSPQPFNWDSLVNALERTSFQKSYLLSTMAEWWS